jgi:amino acid adenylation domain-containing protein
LLDQRSRGWRRSGRSRIPRRSDDGPAPLSFTQERLWFLQQLDAASAAYHVRLVQRVRGPLNLGILEECLTDIVARHEVLRTTFTARDGVPVQTVGAVRPCRVEIDDLTGVPAGHQDETVSQLIERETAKPFDLEHGPLLRVRALHLGNDDHVLLLVMHHIITDAWSVNLLYRELAQRYAARAAGAPPPRYETSLQYADFAVWQRTWVTDDRFAPHLAFWKKQLQDAPAVLNLPTDRPRPAVLSYRGAYRRLRLDARLTHLVNDLARRTGGTAYMVLLAAFQVLLSRYTGQTDLVIGSPIAGRMRPELEQLIGCFINTLALRSNLADDPSFTTYLSRVRQMLLDAYAHQGLPFERLVAELRPERALHATPLFQVLFAFQHAESCGLRFPGTTVEAVDVNTSTTAKHDLSVNLVESDGEIRGAVEYATELFDAESIERLIGHFKNLLQAAVEDPERAVSQLPLLSSAEQEAALRYQDREVPPHIVPDLVAGHALRRPDHVAIAEGSRTITFGDLDARANRIAYALRKRGVGPDVPVAVCLPRSIDFVVTLLGILKAGGAYVPLDPAAPAERLTWMLHDVGAPVVVTTPTLQDRVRSTRAELVAALEADSPATVGPPPPNCRAHSDNIAYIIYTSGSTGRPKGVMVPHRGLSNLVAWHQHAYGIGPTDCGSQLAGLGFDASVWELWPYLAVGARVHLVPEAEALTARDLVAMLNAAEVTVAFLPTPLFETLLAEQEASTLRVRYLLVGGDVLHHGSVPGAAYTLVNHYGPTETSVVATAGAVAPAANGARPPIGSAISGMRTYVASPQLSLLPVGVPGELCIGGAGLARGYVGRPALTADRFRPDPFAASPGARLYRTGDVAQRRSDGMLDFHGRADSQVKIRGFRVEPGEVEHVLRSHPAVRECLVVPRDGATGQRLIAYVGSETRGELIEEELRRGLSAQLPDYMIPAVIVFLPRLPVTANGKIDRAALPSPDVSSSTAETDGAPRTPAEEMLAGIWCEVLGIEQVSRYDDFFELGGHSLLATRVIARLRRVLGVDLGVRALFETPTLAGLAQAIARRAHRDDASAVPALAAGPRPMPIPLSLPQQRIWFMQQLQPASTAFHIPAAWRLRGRFEANALKRSLDELAERHESLRTRFEVRNGVPIQVIEPAGRMRLEIDIETCAGPAAEATVRARVRELTEQPFDLSAGPLWRGHVMRIAPDEHVLILVVHHIIADGWSVGILAQEMATLYNAHATGTSASLPRLALQYADFAVWQRTWWTDEHLRPHVAYWTAHMAGAPAVLELPTDRVRPSQLSGRGARVAVSIRPDLAQAVRRLSRQKDVTLYMTLLAAFQVLLSRYSGQRDVVVGTTIAGRTQTPTEPMIGMFFNVLPMRADLTGDPAFAEFLARVRETTLGAYAHQDLPFERLVQAMAVPRTLSHTPVFQVLFELHNAPARSVTLAGLQMDRLGDDIIGIDIVSETAKFDLTMALEERAGAIGGTIEYSTDLFEAGTMERFARHYVTLLESIVAAPQQRISTLAIIPPSERHQIVDQLNDTARAWPDACLGELFEAQVAATPEAIAVEDASGRTWTYSAVNAHANQLARYLQRHGIGPEERVGLCVPRTVDLIVGMLAVLKAGGAYVPLDPTYPAERLRYMVQDARARVVLTDNAGAALLGPIDAAIVTIDGEAAAVEAECTGNLPQPVSADNLAYVYYTSGSTGRPKGVAVNHAGIVNYVRWGCEAYHAAEGNGAPVHTSIAVDLTLTNFLPLFAGQRVTLIRESAGVDGLLSALQQQPKWGLLKLTPTHLALLNPAMTGAERQASSRVLVIGADQLAAEPTLVWRQTAPQVTLINEYGPTETVVGCCTHTLGATTPVAGGVPIGRPIANTTMYVIDAALQVVPAGVPGELYIGGIGVARGYWGRPRLTAEKFVPDPFSSVPGARLYRTGDRARYRPNGDLECLGRLDFQAKIRGYRVEPGEVEAMLAAHPSVRKAVAVVREDEPGDRRLVAYVTVGDHAPTVTQLREYLKARLPEHMMPSSIMVLSSLPIGASGKIDRRALPRADGERPSLDTHYQPPTDSVERRLTALWEELLEVRPIGLDDNFYDVGGHSLLAIRLRARIRDRFGAHVPLGLFVTNPTIRAMAESFRDHIDTAAQVLVAIQPNGTKAPLFCVHPAGGQVQCYVGLARRLGGDQPVYGLRDPFATTPGGYSRVSIREAAETYVAAIRNVRPHGPYYLVGWSFGGSVALEMAQQLRRAGEDVPLLIQFDTPAPPFLRTLRRSEHQDCIVLAALARELAVTAGADLQIASTDLVARPPQERATYLVAALKAAGVRRPDVTADAFDSQLERFWGRIRTLQVYDAEPYEGRVALFRAIESDDALEHDWPEFVGAIRRNPTLGWDQVVTTPVEVFHVPGHHATIGAEPHVGVLATMLAERLETGHAVPEAVNATAPTA